MQYVKRNLLVLSALAFLGGGFSANAQSSDCGYSEEDPSGGGFSYCIRSWCGTGSNSCNAYDCVFADGTEYHWISPACNVSLNAAPDVVPEKMAMKVENSQPVAKCAGSKFSSACPAYKPRLLPWHAFSRNSAS